ncbi:MAG: DUF721 domain-containing protein [candidate division WOR-3 bacterium]|nr:DUF721 domain-containing protein [candidate division WOR-3 bacterium]
MEPHLLGKVLKEFIQSKPLGGNLSQIELLSGWKEIFPPVICKHAKPIGIRGNELIIMVSSSAWLNELSFLKEELKNRLNEKAGKELIKEIRFYLKED